MQLLLFVLIAGVVGYFLAKSRLSKPIDSTAGKVADGTRKAASSTEGWFSRTFRRDRKPKDEVVEAEAKPAEASVVEEAATATKQSSRRHSEDEPAA